MTGRALAPIEIAPQHLLELRDAKQPLEGPRFAIQVVNLFGVPIEQGIAKLPAALARKNSSRQSRGARTCDGHRVVERRCVSAAASERAATQTRSNGHRRRRRRFRRCRACAGAACVDNRDAAFDRRHCPRRRAKTCDLPDTKLACLTVFALGGRSQLDDAAESAYYIARVSLANAVSEAAHHLMSKHAVKGAAPPLVRLIQRIAARFSVQVSEKAAAQAVPIIGAAGGAMLNWLFISHYQQMAQWTFHDSTTRTATYPRCLESNRTLPRELGPMDTLDLTVERIDAIVECVDHESVQALHARHGGVVFVRHRRRRQLFVRHVETLGTQRRGLHCALRRQSSPVSRSSRRPSHS